jgi:hypothetical protein
MKKKLDGYVKLREAADCWNGLKKSLNCCSANC